jgi:phosphoglucosamine mutase
MKPGLEGQLLKGAVMKYFGTDGIRGQANVGAMSPQMVLRVGQAIGLTLREIEPKPKVIIGKDTRVSGYTIEGVLLAGLCSVGAYPLVVGPLPTPGVAYLTRGMRATAGIMISASHNPYQDNGIKIFDKDGFKLPDLLEAKIESMIDDPDLEHQLVTGESFGRARRVDDAIGQYAVFLKERFPKDLSLEGRRIVIDCAHGAGYRVAPKVFAELGAEVICINDEPNGLNINQDGGSLYPERLQAEVLKYRADLGFAMDGDADRITLVDEQGHVIDGDQILVLCALHLKRQGLLKADAVVCTVMSNMGVDLALAAQGIRVVKTPVGDRHVMEAMRREGAILGGEQSGHIIFLDSSTSGDAILAALKVLEIMERSGEKASALGRQMQKLPQVTLSVKVPHKPVVSELPRFSDALKAREAELSGHGRLLFRYSGTEPKARITVEGPDWYRVREIADDLERILLKDIERWVEQKSS